MSQKSPNYDLHAEATAFVVTQVIQTTRDAAAQVRNLPDPVTLSCRFTSGETT